MSKTNNYPFVITNSGGKALVTIKDSGEVELDGNPNEAAKIFWSAFSNLWNQAVKDHVAGKLEQFNIDIEESLDGKK